MSTPGRSQMRIPTRTARGELMPTPGRPQVLNPTRLAAPCVRARRVRSGAARRPREAAR